MWAPANPGESLEATGALGLKVIAEGVETADQIHRLTQIGCTHFQGYYYSGPIDARGIGDLLAGRSKLVA